MASSPLGGPAPSRSSLPRPIPVTGGRLKAVVVVAAAGRAPPAGPPLAAGGPAGPAALGLGLSRRASGRATLAPVLLGEPAHTLYQHDGRRQHGEEPDVFVQAEDRIRDEQGQQADHEAQ